MRYIDYEPGGSADTLRVAEGPTPAPQAGEILIEVAYAGVNRPDILQRSGRYPPPPGASPILGLEVSGHIIELGSGVSEWRVGDAVTALVPGGGYAECCTTPADQALRIPTHMDLASAAGLPENWFTVWANVADMGALKEGERLLVHGGTSGIGLTAIHLASFLGATCWATVGNDDKAAFCRASGAHHVINYRTADFAEAVMATTDHQGVDVILDVVGLPYLARHLAILRRDGRLVFVALSGGSRGEIDLSPILTKRLRLSGSAMRPRTVAEKRALRDALAQHIWPELDRGRLLPHIGARFPLAEAARAHALMESGDHRGKIVLAVKP